MQRLSLLGHAVADMGEWATRGHCIGSDPAVFFPERGESTSEAKRICRECPVQPECFDWGMAHEKHGIWGGLSERERRRLRTKAAWMARGRVA